MCLAHMDEASSDDDLWGGASDEPADRDQLDREGEARRQQFYNVRLPGLQAGAPSTAACVDTAMPCAVWIQGRHG